MDHRSSAVNVYGTDWCEDTQRTREHLPDNVQFGPESWLYIAANQLHRTSAFTGGADKGRPPYRVMRVWTGTGGASRR